MKFMGSKRTMLLNGLGKLIKEIAPRHDRIVDLFCGSASVSWFAATVCNHPVLSVDLQKVATTLAGAVTLRTKAIEWSQLYEKWVEAAKCNVVNSALWREAIKIDSAGSGTLKWCKRARQFCAGVAGKDSLLLSAYGGHYFSPTQALLLDAMLKSIPQTPARDVCKAALIMAASQCAASPGHTAQPFQPTATAGMFLREAWLKEPVAYVEKALRIICPMHAKVRGETIVGDAVDVAKVCDRKDLIFVDPPYSAVQYSRFYHVLETIARGKCGDVSGVGRYPPISERPPSGFSRRGQAQKALRELLEALAASHACVALTFPEGECSNGLSGNGIEYLAKKWFTVRNYAVKSQFSTLGGNNENRSARQSSRELILLLKPKRATASKRELTTVGKR